MEGIVTTYGAARFRSRLEARWAALFDLLKWPWIYERLALDGAGPDDFGRWTAVLEAWRDDPEAALIPPIVRPVGPARRVA